jgi:HAD superfamily hydrolase (TIGR01459 family)
VCSGLFDDEVETAENYREHVEMMCARRLLMVCANPDVVVERGDKLVYCAGAIADFYAESGGEVLYAGKPYRPIYQQAVAAAEKARGRAVEHGRVLAIGDSIRTDLKGAAAFGIDGLFVIAGIHAEELGGHEDPDVAMLHNMFAANGVSPKAVMRRLRW